MYKYFFILLFIFFSISSIKAENIDKVSITGNKRLSSETIKIYGDIEINKNYSDFDHNLVPNIKYGKLGKDFNYSSAIRSPNELGMSPAGNFDALSADIAGLINYTEVLVSGTGRAIKGKLGNVTSVIINSIYLIQLPT